MASPQEYLIALTHLKVVTYFHVASTALAVYVYDYFLTLQREVSLVWPSPWTPIKILFLLTRYIPFVDGALMLYFQFQQHPTAEVCHATYKTISWLFYIGTVLPEAILSLRTWAV